MKGSFRFWKDKHDHDEWSLFNDAPSGILWLKIKSIRRRGILDEFIEKYQYRLQTKKLDDQFEELFDILSRNLEKSHLQLNEFIKEKHVETSASLDIEALISELYKLKHFGWGGDYQNALDKHLVNQYVKKIPSYQQLAHNLETKIVNIVSSYVFCSWYNHWSSILIEHLFKAHTNVLPAIGQIKGIDFFIREIPFDWV